MIYASLGHALLRIAALLVATRRPAAPRNVPTLQRTAMPRNATLRISPRRSPTRHSAARRSATQHYAAPRSTPLHQASRLNTALRNA